MTGTVMPLKILLRHGQHETVLQQTFSILKFLFLIIGPA